MTTAQRRPVVAMLYPGSAAQDDYPRLEALVRRSSLLDDVRLPVVIVPIDSDEHTVAAMRAVGEADRLNAAANEAAELHPSALMWACTSGSFLYGLSGAHAQVDRLSETVGLPVSSTSLAFVAACAHLGIDTVAVAATYPAAVSAGFTAFLGDAGIAVAAGTPNDVATATDAGRMDPDAVRAMVTAADVPTAGAVLVPDTALHTVASIDALERAVGKVVLTANLVTAWYGLQLTGVTARAEGLGTLFRPVDAPIG